ncbi:hypothetical protein AWB81_04187 [Caballeronia arationis]|nr:hypothetical protein AWB81_04187 [Caballeronia arationis]
MTLQYMEGYESVIETSDLTRRGRATSQQTNVNGNTVCTVPSRSGAVGRGLMLKGPYCNVSGMPLPSAPYPNFGMVTTRAQGQVGLVSGTVEGDGAAVSGLTATPSFASRLQSVDPNTNQPWTLSGARAVKVAVAKVT